MAVIELPFTRREPRARSRVDWAAAATWMAIVSVTVVVDVLLAIAALRLLLGWI